MVRSDAVDDAADIDDENGWNTPLKLERHLRACHAVLGSEPDRTDRHHGGTGAKRGKGVTITLHGSCAA